MSIILFRGGVPGQVHPHPRQVHPPGQVPLPRQIHPSSRYTPQAGTPPGQVPQAGTPPREQCMLGDMGNKRVVRILLECTVVWQGFCRKLHENERNWIGGTFPSTPLRSANNIFAKATSLPDGFIENSI